MKFAKFLRILFFYRRVPVAASDVQLVFSRESGTKTGATVSDKYQVQLKKSICYRRNQYLRERDNFLIPESFYFSILSFSNFAMAKSCFVKTFLS